MADELIGDAVESGLMMVYNGKDISLEEAEDRRKRRRLVTQVIFLLNITKVEDRTCCLTVNLFVVEIPEGVQRIGEAAFGGCPSLTTVTFPTTLISIGESAFFKCSNLDNVDLLHTNLQKIG